MISLLSRPVECIANVVDKLPMDSSSADPTNSTLKPHILRNGCKNILGRTIQFMCT